MRKQRTLLPIKKAFIFLLLLISAFTIVSCSEQTGTPYGSISENTVYLEIGSYRVTQRELYDKLRLNADSTLNTMITEVIFKEFIDALSANSLNDFQRETIDKAILTTVFGSSATPEGVASLSEQNRAQSILSFVDSFTIVDPTVNKDDLTNYILNRLGQMILRVKDEDFDADDFDMQLFDYNENPQIAEAFLERYKLTIAQRDYAKSIFGEVTLSDDGMTVSWTLELADEESTVFIDEQAIVSYYNSNIKGQYDVSAVIVAFNSTAESNHALRKYSIKANSRGEWFRIPNIGDINTLTAIANADEDDENDPNGRAKAILLTINELVINTPDGPAIDLAKFPNGIGAETEFSQTYYNSYTIRSAVDIPLDTSNDNNEVLQIFKSMYDDINNTNISSLTRSELEEKFTFGYNDYIFTQNTTLRSHVYGLLSDTLYQDPNNEEEGQPYSRSVQSAGTGQYLVYLLADDRASDEGVLIEDPEDADLEIFDPESLHAQAIKFDAATRLAESKFTDSYVTTTSGEKSEDISIDIFDPIIRQFYEFNYEYDGSTGFKDNETLAVVDGISITVDEFFERIESTLGLSTALDMITINKLRDTYGDQITDEQMDEFREEFETSYVNPFLADNFASSGFPATMGLDNFLLLAFGVQADANNSATRNAIDVVYVQQELRTIFFEDYDVHFATPLTEEDNIFQRLADISANIYNNRVGTTMSHLLIYVDYDNDGNADNPSELDFASLGLQGINNLADFEAKVEELALLIRDEAEKQTGVTYSTAITNVVSRYDATTRFTLPSTDANAIWQEYKALGMKLRFESLGQFTNENNFPTTESTAYDQAFYDYALALTRYATAYLEQQGEDNLRGILPIYSPNVLNAEVENEDQTEVIEFERADFSAENSRSSFGWHSILITDILIKESAELTTSDTSSYESDHLNPYVSEDKPLSSLNDSSLLSWQQILIYLKESQDEEGIRSLTTSVRAAITSFFDPIKVLYMDTDTSSYMQLELTFRFVFDLQSGETEIHLDDAVMNQKLQALRATNFNQFFKYSYFEGFTGDGTDIHDIATNKEFAKVYGSWFTILTAEHR